MRLDNLTDRSILGNEINAFASEQRVMSLDSIELPPNPVLAWAATEVGHLPLEVAVQQRQAHLAERVVDTRTSAERTEDTFKARGEDIAKEAVKFLFGSVPSFAAEFHFGADLHGSERAYEVQHQAYLGRLGLLTENGALMHDEEQGKFTALQTGRTILRQERHVDDQLVVVRYVNDDGDRNKAADAVETALHIIAAGA